jgi:putative restriction endonuclease
MLRALYQSELLDTLVHSIQTSDWKLLILNNKKPFRFRLYKESGHSFDLRIYIWNCTHGGGSARAADEYRVQLTSTVPSTVPGETTLLLGWHSGYEVFVGFDITRHEGQDSASPSIQIKEQTLKDACNKPFGIYPRKNGEIAVAFRPDFFVDYALNASSLHELGSLKPELSLLSRIDTATSNDITEIANYERQTLLSTIARKHRAADFSKRVLGAYAHRCAACGIQLELIDAAHIIPVAAPSSTDETRNGIALCKLHHQAYDRNLISFNNSYQIEISNYETERLTSSHRASGMPGFAQQLLSSIILPADTKHYPPPEYIEESRRVRAWVN